MATTPGKRLVIPVTSTARSPAWDEIVAFAVMANLLHRRMATAVGDPGEKGPRPGCTLPRDPGLGTEPWPIDRKICGHRPGTDYLTVSGTVISPEMILAE
ncbi:hypothetical protein GCM10009810_06450 [Nostocoides vanveenii]|uniref:Transposase n=1 Tax=Nostocoides vanveenii TaxID=330835 RepID=A0ABP4W7C3_9MICO